MGEQDSRVTAILDFIKKQKVTRSSTGKLVINGITCTSNLNAFLKVYTEESTLSFLSELNSSAKTKLGMKAFIKLNENADEYKPTQIQELEGLRLFVDGEGAVRVLNPDFTKSSQTEKRLLKLVGRSKFEKYVVENAEGIEVTYNPYSCVRMKHTPEDEFDILNTYEPPFWKTEQLYKKELPLVLKKQFEYFIPDSKCRHYFYCWMKDAIFDRCGTYLLLLGAKGTGKTMLCNLLERAIGKSNFGAAQRSFLTKEFNSILRERQIVVLDEIKANTDDKKEKLKSYINDEQTLEAKGIEAVTSERIYASFIITNNSKTHVHIEQDDRRFSAMDLTTTPMVEEFGVEYCREINEAVLKDDKLILDFVSFLKFYDDSDYDSYIPYKGKVFKEVVVLSLNMWQQVVYETLTSRKEYSYEYRDLFPRGKSVMSPRPRTHQLVLEFLREYKYKGEPIGTLEFNDDKEMIIRPCKALLPEGDDCYEEL